MRKTLSAAFGLELYALLLAGLHALGGVRTDEAKYLLDIPYPHPPLLRGIMHSLEALPFQEMLWRVVFATAFVQAVWLVWDMARGMQREARLAICMAWLLSGGVMLWAGAVMIAPLNALQGMVLVWLLWRPELAGKWPAAVSIFWLCSLLTGYQAVLYLPLVVAIFLRTGVPLWQSVLYVCGPIGVLLLATLGNPLAVASLLHHGSEQLAATTQYKVFHTGRLWFIGGSMVASLMGTFGILRSKRWELVAAFLCVTAFIFLNWFEYYSVLFTPLLIAGLLFFFHRRRVIPQTFMILLAAGAIVTVTMWPLGLSGSPARTVMTALQERGVQSVQIAGAFGHEWQYESRVPVRRFSPERASEADAVVCLYPCDGWVPGGAWQAVGGLPVPVWIRK